MKYVSNAPPLFPDQPFRRLDKKQSVVTHTQNNSCRREHYFHEFFDRLLQPWLECRLLIAHISWSRTFFEPISGKIVFVSRSISFCLASKSWKYTRPFSMALRLTVFFLLVAYVRQTMETHATHEEGQINTLQNHNSKWNYAFEWGKKSSNKIWINVIIIVIMLSLNVYFVATERTAFFWAGNDFYCVHYLALILRLQ